MAGNGPFAPRDGDGEAPRGTAQQGTLEASRRQARSRTAPFSISQHEHDRGASVVTVQGELDLATAPSLKWALSDIVDAGALQIVVDLSPVTFIDSTALGVLVGVQRSLGAGARLAIVGAGEDVLNIFELSGLDLTFDMFPTLDEALIWVCGSEAATG